MTFSLLVLCKNEIEGMKVVMPRIKKEWLDEIIIVDGGSTDGSVEYAKSLGFRVVNQKSKGVLGGIKEGLDATTTDYVITFTPDNNMLPEKIPDVIALLNEGYDMVCVSRYAPGAKSDDDNAVTGFGNWFFTTLVNVLFKAHYSDVLGFYRGYRRSLPRELKRGVRLSISTQLSIHCTKKKLKVIDIPGDEPPRVGGQSSRSILINGVIELGTILQEFIFR